ncbi:RagB/SusD family nutrient uptake outer membrane protein [Saccharicrinis aurantiacus]|uniref:RagB/SusD family nutrient uptake outer membrane protein n=1 Tax=Saccharicrinis aurantiacus TaxID=1849719 RepID=UPI002492A4F3|nr:RagB/SusD family nutrient uptake outer membrane protein [Saccharicrinis aurantiacus]
MYKIKLYTILLTIAFAFSSCMESFLNEDPSTGLPDDEVVESLTDFDYVVNGVYHLMNHRYYYSGDFGVTGALRGDGYKSLKSFNQFSPVGRYDTNPVSHFALGYWEQMYKALGAVNRAIELKENVPADEQEDPKYDQLVGELYAIRATIHFDVARTFADLPTYASQSSNKDANGNVMGIPLADKLYGTDHLPTRASLEETYDFIVADYDTAITFLNEDITRGGGGVGVSAAKGLKARVLLYLERDQEALDLAKEVIEGSSIPLVDASNYVDAWTKENGPGNLFAIIANARYNASLNSVGYYTQPDSYEEVFPTDEEIAFIQSDANDVRKDVIITSLNEGGEEMTHLNKFAGRDNQVTINPVQVIRIAELYLIAAEAAVKEGNSTDALKYYNDLRRNRFTNYTDATEVTLDDILDERRREFTGENHRSYDLLRNNRSFLVPNVGEEEISQASGKNLFAIPQREIDASKGSIQQNSYYAN